METPVEAPSSRRWRQWRRMRRRVTGQRFFRDTRARARVVVSPSCAIKEPRAHAPNLQFSREKTNPTLVRVFYLLGLV